MYVYRFVFVHTYVCAYIIYWYTALRKKQIICAHFNHTHTPILYAH